MEFILAGGSLLGAYLANQQSRENNFIEQNSVPLSAVASQYPVFNSPEYKNAVGCTGMYPMYRSPDGRIYGNAEDPNYINFMNQNYNNAQVPYPQSPQPYKYAFKQEQEHFENVKEDPWASALKSGAVQIQSVSDERNNFIPNNDPTSEYLVDIKDRPVSDFTHNNMVPFFGSKVTQNMAGTGVKSGNYIDGVTIDTGSDNTSPYQATLNRYSGLDDTYLHKREIGPMFSPAEQQTSFVYGTPVVRPDTSMVKQGFIKRNDLRPVEPIHVGKGLNIDPSIPASGGFHEFTRVMPNNVSDYKANQLEGRVVAGKFQTGGELPASYPGVGAGRLNNNPNHQNGPGVTKNRPDTFYAQNRRPTMSNYAGGMPNFQMLRSDYASQNPNNAKREETNFGLGTLRIVPENKTENFQQQSQKGPEFCVDETTFGVNAPSRPSQMGLSYSETFMNLDNNIRSRSDCNSLPIGNPSRGSQGGHLTENMYVNETGRGTINPLNEQQMNLKGPNVFNNYIDEQKTTMKETLEFNREGNPEREGQAPTFYTYDDALKTTMKETTMFNREGNPDREGQAPTFYSYDDELKTTMKETTMFNREGNPDREGQATTFYTYSDKPKPTIKQSTNFTYAGVAGNSSGLGAETSRFQFFGPDDNNNNVKEMFANIDVNNLVSPKIRTGGADMTTNRSTTHISYTPGAGRQNIRQDPEDIIGKVDFGTFGLRDLVQDGAGSLLRSLPNATRFQNTFILGKNRVKPNKLFAEDNRQIAGYQVEQLTKNPLSIYNRNPDGEIPNLFAFNAPDDYSTMTTSKKSLDDDNVSVNGLLSSVPVYPNFDGKVVNANESVVYGNEYNPMVEQGSSRTLNNVPTFSGKAYSGIFENGEKSTLGGPENDPITIYGNPIEVDVNKMITVNPALDFTVMS